MTTHLTNGLMYGCISPKLVREVALNLLEIEQASLVDISLLLGVPTVEAEPVWKGMIEDGWIVEKDGSWMASDNIRSLAVARFSKPMTRAVADAMAKKIIANAVAINADQSEEHLIWITKIAFFGSYITDKELLGDLDVAWSYATRATGKRKSIDMICNGKDDTASVRAKVFPRSPKLSLHAFSELDLLKCDFRVVYEFEPTDRPALEKVEVD